MPLQWSGILFYGYIYKKEAFKRLPYIVEQGYKLSNKFIEDLQKIHDYIEHFHVNLTR